MADAGRFSTVAVVVLDSVGCGGAPDAADFGDEGANTLGHVIEAAAPALPNLAALGLGRIPGVPSLAGGDAPSAAYGRLRERGPGKDTMLGHWELMGVVARELMPLYPDGFPEPLLTELGRRTGHTFIGNRASSGTVIMEELGAQHLRDGAVIVYTSGDSVFQVAAHVDRLPLQGLYELCEQARALLRGEHAVGRVIARPFRGPPGAFERLSANRRDYPLSPPHPTALDHLLGAGVSTLAIGKIDDIFAGSGVGARCKTANNAEGVEATCAALSAGAAQLIFANLVDFDSRFGHRNDVHGYGAALAAFDREVPSLLAALLEDGMLVLTADHGNDPTWPGTDHTRELVPLLVAGSAVQPGDLGLRDFADLGATLLDNFGVEAALDGRSFLAALGSDG